MTLQTPTAGQSSQGLAALQQAKTQGSERMLRQVTKLLDEEADQQEAYGRTARAGAQARAATMEEAEAANLAGDQWDHAAAVLRRIKVDLERAGREAKAVRRGRPRR
jgi:hypothetical protein